MITPILKDIAPELTTERLLLRCPRPGDGRKVYEAVSESLCDLRAWPASLPWAMVEPSVEASETFCRESHAQFIKRTSLTYLAFDHQDRLVVSTSLHNINWQVPKFEIGFWCRSGCHRQGFSREAVHALISYAQLSLGARRVDCITDAKNHASRALCEKLGMALESILRNERITPAGVLRNTCIYAIAFDGATNA